MILLDAYNVLHATGILPPDLAGLELRELINLIAESRFGNRSVTLVCDGNRPKNAPERLPAPFVVLFAGAGRSADDLIESLVARSTSPRRLTLVTSDNRLATVARRRGVRIESSERFLELLERDHRRPRLKPLPPIVREIPLDAHAIAHWMREFGFQADESQVRLALVAREARRNPTSHAAKQPTASPPSPPLPPARPLDPDLLRLIEEWGGGIDLDDLDMQRWLDKT